MANIESDKLYEFKKNLRMLREFRGSGTELISVYIGSGSPLHDMTSKLREEMSQASNIKSKSTRTNVTGALERILGYFKIYKGTPKNGIVVFCGNISDNPAKTEMELVSFEPPVPLEVTAYRCDSKFFLEPLERMIEHKDVYGIVVMDGREATLALVKGTYTETVKKLNSMAHAKVSKGGQSQRRYQRLVEETIENYYKRVGASIDEHFLGKTKGVIVGGPGPTKEFFMKAKPFNYQIKVLGVVDTGYTDEYGIREVLAKSEDIISEQEAIKEKIMIDRFIKEISKDGLAVYGEANVKEVILSNQAERVLLSEELTDKKYYYVCTCGNRAERTSKEKLGDRIPCDQCHLEMKLEKKISLIDEIVDMARSSNIPIDIVSSGTTEGKQFLEGFGGMGAFLRYRK